MFYGYISSEPMKEIIVFVFVLIFSGQAFSQNLKLQKLFDAEKDLKQQFDTLYSLQDTPERDSLNRSIIRSLTKEATTWDGFFYPWNKLDRIGKVFSEDRKIKLFSWHLREENGNTSYYGLVIVSHMKKRKKSKTASFQTFELKDRHNTISNPESQMLNAENWLGAVYYDLKSFSHKKKQWYILTGIDIMDDFTNRKILEILSLPNKNSLQFGKEIHNSGKNLKRLLLEYSDKVAVTLRFDENLGMFVFDHLAPMEPVFRGNYRFYTPDGSYDGLRYEKGKLYLEEDIDARNY